MQQPDFTLTGCLRIWVQTAGVLDGFINPPFV
ncbi:Uncharacterised protein [Vibrio cholerae]|nr:Uncharacterised protein [Vibrio cholerae]